MCDTINALVYENILICVILYNTLSGTNHGCFYDYIAQMYLISAEIIDNKIIKCENGTNRKNHQSNTFCEF